VTAQDYSDAQVEAALDAWFDDVRPWSTIPLDQRNAVRMRAALAAASVPARPDNDALVRIEEHLLAIRNRVGCAPGRDDG